MGVEDVEMCSDSDVVWEVEGVFVIWATCDILSECESHPGTNAFTAASAVTGTLLALPRMSAVWPYNNV